MNFKILNTIGVAFADEAKKKLEVLGEVTYKIPTQVELEKEIENFDMIVVGLGLLVNKTVITNGKNLKVIATATTGLDHIDVSFAEEKGVKVVSLKNDLEFMKKITGTAELAWGLLVALARKIPSSFDSVKEGHWQRENFKGNSLSGKTLGVLGLGRLGTLVAGYGKAFGMEVLFCDPNVESLEGTRKVSFEELLKESDCLSVHVHLTKETENMISEKEFNQMKNGCFIVNTSRGKIVDEDALLKVLKDKKVAGYATDVLSDELDFGEQIPESNPMLQYAKENTNLIIVPHTGGMTHESRILTDIRVVEKIEESL